MDYKEKYNYWLSGPFDEETKAELRAITDEKEIEDRFYKDLEFGTGGARGIMGAGSNRMNKYNIRRITQGFADWINSGGVHGDPQGKHAAGIAAEAKVAVADTSVGKTLRSVAIAHDVRNNSYEFAKEAALVLAANGIKAYFYEDISQTPLLSFTTRHLNCSAGIMITASHNPKIYNGYKAYNGFGCQLVPEESDELLEYVSKSSYESVRIVEEDAARKSGLLVNIDDSVRNAFLEAVKGVTNDIPNAAKQAIKVVYTPLHGTGNLPVRQALKDLGYTNINVVPEQENPDGEFPTVKSPNPEDKAALTMGIELAEKIGADIVIGTDPDADRIGIAVRAAGKPADQPKCGCAETGAANKQCAAATAPAPQFALVNGNQVGALLAYYMLGRKKEAGKLNEKSTLITTIVTGDMGPDIAKSYGLKVVKTLTGFKNMGERMDYYDSLGPNAQNEFELAYEESYGYLVGDYARDKCSVSAACIICEMAAYYKQQGKSLLDVLEEMYAKYGYYLDYLDNFVFTGKEGVEKMQGIMETLRSGNPEEMLGIAGPIETKDYLKGIEDVPADNVLKFVFPGGDWIAARPSGTEPKIKFYYCIKGNDRVAAEARLEGLRAHIAKLAE